VLVLNDPPTRQSKEAAAAAKEGGSLAKAANSLKVGGAHGALAAAAVVAGAEDLHAGELLLCGAADGLGELLADASKVGTDGQCSPRHQTHLYPR
jgi:hypothetical protein